MSLFNSLNIGYSGLTTSQIGISVTGNNIANAETEGYSRQRVVTAAATPIGLDPGQRGNGSDVTEIVRIFDQFVFDRYSDTSEKKENSDFLRKTMEELSSYFPEIDNVGIKTDLQEYFNMWQSFADNPDNNAVKIALSQQTETLSQHINQTRTQVTDLQDSINNQLFVAVDEVNRLAKEIANINGAILAGESDGVSNANDLKDRRNVLERSIDKLIDSDVFGGLIESKTQTDSNIAVKSGSYSLLVSGFNIIDGPNFHEIGISKETNASGMYDVYFEKQDGKRINFTDQLHGGKIGAILELRGSTVNTVDGTPTNGTLQTVLNQLDTFAEGIIEHTNNLYARSATDEMQSNIITTDANQGLTSSGHNINKGSFDVIVYNIDGEEVATRTIEINDITVLDDTVTDGTTTPPTVTPATTSSIIGQINRPKDDNADNNPDNDINSLITAKYINGQVSFAVNNKSEGYTFSIKDNFDENSQSGGTNFAGALGMSRYFDGSNAKDIRLNSTLQEDPSLIKGHAEESEGNNLVALDMIQLQFERVEFTTEDKNGVVKVNDTIYGYFDSIASDVGSKTNAIIIKNDSLTAQFSAIELEYESVSKVSIDEELTNLIKYQTAYGAAAKVITTIDQMMNTLLGIKQ
jgi:flagellar hook-associated protein 1